MGRGRQKAKQTKVARRLKYFTPDTDYGALERELSGSPDEFDPYAEDADDEDEGDEFEDDDDDVSWTADIPPAMT